MKFLLAATIVVLITASGFLENQGPVSPGNPKSITRDSSLKDAFKKDFLIGTALNVSQIEERDPFTAHFIPVQFNSITA